MIVSFWNFWIGKLFHLKDEWFLIIEIDDFSSTLLFAVCVA